MAPDDLLALLHRTAGVIAETLTATAEWGLAGTKPGQYRSDIAADSVAVEMLLAAGVGVLSEESGTHHGERDVTVVLDPLDGSTNASRRISWWAVSLCAVEAGVPVASVVVDLAHGASFEATRGGGARCDAVPLRPSGATELGTSIIGVNGLPPAHLGWGQFRALGAAALDMCAVAAGSLDGYIDCTTDSHGPWDYLGALLVCTEAGVAVADAHGRDLVVLDHAARRTPVVAATPGLLDQMLVARRASEAGS